MQCNVRYVCMYECMYVNRLFFIFTHYIFIFYMDIFIYIYIYIIIHTHTHKYNIQYIYIYVQIFYISCIYTFYAHSFIILHNSWAQCRLQVRFSCTATPARICRCFLRGGSRWEVLQVLSQHRIWYLLMFSVGSSGSG